MATAIEILAEIISKKMEKKTSLFSHIEIDTIDYPLELATIDEMPIYAYLEFNVKYKCIKFIIISNKIIDYDVKNEDGTIIYYENPILPSDSNKKNEKYTIEEIIQAIGAVREILPQLKFNISIGEFVTDDEPNKELLALHELFAFDNVTSIYTPCSVCHETTKTKTKCNHPLCYRCWEKLFANQFGGIIKCPICRKVINPNDDEASEGSEASEWSEGSEAPEEN